MKINNNITLLIFILGLGIVSSFDTLTADQEDKAVNKAITNFYVALNEMFKGNIEPMKEAWSHADDVTYLPPTGGIKSGWKEVLSEWQAQADQKLGGTVEPSDIKISINGNIATTVNFEKGSNVDSDGNPVEISIRATNTFRKERGKWKMIGHHTDLLPFLQKQGSH